MMQQFLFPNGLCPSVVCNLFFHKGKQLFLQNDLKLQPQSFICGQSIGFSDVLSTGRIEMITVVFQPYAAKALLHIPVHLFHGKDVAMDGSGRCRTIGFGEASH